MHKPRYSLIIPIWNEAQSLAQLFKELSLFTPPNAEILAVDDGSSDQTYVRLRALGKQFPKLRLIHLKAHQGKWTALKAGLDKAHGDFIITLDADLQDDPSQITHLLAVQKQTNADIVSGWRKRRYDALYKVIISAVGNALVSALSGRRWHDLNAPLKLYRREILRTIPTDGSLIRFSLLFANRLGFKTKEIPIAHRPRIFGTSKFGLQKYLRILYDLILVLLLFSGSGRLKKPISA